jgi:hypothetical protein
MEDTLTKDPEAFRHAAVAAVMRHLEEERGFGSRAQQQAFLSLAPWALNGRQSIMQMNGLLQRRVLKRRRGWR